MNTRDGRRVAAAVTAALLVVACTAPGEAGVPGPTSQHERTFVETLPVPSSLPSPASSTSVPRIPSPASAEIVRQERRYYLPEPLGPLALAHGVAPTLLPPGEHSTDVLGIEMTFGLDDWWQMATERLGTLQLTRTDTPIGRQLPTVLFERPVGLAEHGHVADGNMLPGQYPVPAEELGSWLEDLPQIEVLATGEAIAGDRTGRWYEVALDPDAGPTLDDCAPGRCVSTWWSGASGTVVAREGEALRYYEFPDPEGPIFVLVAADPDGYDDWVAVTDTLIRNTTFGPSAPHPVPVGVSVGRERAHARGESWRFGEFPGIAIDGDDVESISRQRPGSLGYEPWGPSANSADSSIVRPVQGADGRPMATLQDVIGELEGSSLERVDDEMIFDTTAAVFTGAADEPIFRRAPVEPGDVPDFVHWPDFLHVHVWAFESPIGPLLIAAESDGSAGLEVGIRHAARLLELVSFDCSDGACVTPDPTDSSE